MKQKTLPKITVITPSYNQGHFITETIDSVLSQNYPNLEYIVMDGGSTDDTVDILKSYGKKFTWVSKKDKGQTDAINKGIKKSTGDIICYLNSDDVFLPNTLNTVAEYFMQNPEAMWVTGDYFIIDADGNKIQSFVAEYKKWLRQNPSKQRLSIANYIIQPSTFWRKELTQEIGLSTKISITVWISTTGCVQSRNTHCMCFLHTSPYLESTVIQKVERCTKSSSTKSMNLS